MRMWHTPKLCILKSKTSVIRTRQAPPPTKENKRTYHIKSTLRINLVAQKQYR